MDSFFGMPITDTIILEIILINGLIFALGIFGFRNIKRYIADLKTQLRRIRDKRKEMS